MHVGHRGHDRMRSGGHFSRNDDYHLSHGYMQKSIEKLVLASQNISHLIVSEMIPSFSITSDAMQELAIIALLARAGGLIIS